MPRSARGNENVGDRIENSNPAVQWQIRRISQVAAPEQRGDRKLQTRNGKSTNFLNFQKNTRIQFQQRLGKAGPKIEVAVSSGSQSLFGLLTRNLDQLLVSRTYADEIWTFRPLTTKTDGNSALGFSEFCPFGKTDEQARYRSKFWTSSKRRLSEDAILENAEFNSFRIFKMSKQIRKLEKETASWKSRYEAAHRTLLQMTEEKLKSDQNASASNRKLVALQGLCRSLQAQCTSLRSELKG